MTLNGEQIKLLRRLVVAEKNGMGASYYIDKIRRPNSEPAEGGSGYQNFPIYPKSEEYKSIEKDLEALVREGYLERVSEVNKSYLKFGNLTSNGRCYFKDNRRAMAKAYVHDYSLAIVTGITGLIAGTLIEALTGRLLLLGQLERKSFQ